MTNSETVLIVGADSTIGAGLMSALRNAGNPVIGTTRRQQNQLNSLRYLNLADNASDWDIPKNIAVAVLCAAMTSLADCSNKPNETAIINVDQTCCLAQRLMSRGVNVIFLSTNLVFDGTQPFVNADALKNPQTEYGRQKALVEDSLTTFGGRCCIVRMTKVFSTNAIISNWMTDLKAGRVIRAFHDYPLSPVALSFVIDVLRTVIANDARGVIQIGASDEITYAELARDLSSRLGFDPRLIEDTSAQSLPYPIPAYASLDSTRLRKEFEFSVPRSRDVVAMFTDTMQSSAKPGM